MKQNPCYIGLDIGGTKIFAARFSLTGKLEASTRLFTDARKGRDTVLQNIRTALNKVKTNGVRAIGIAWAGFVNTGQRTIVKAPHIPDFENYPLSKKLEKEYNLPVFVENDARLFALAEARVGAGKGYADILGVILGTGIGSGILINGKIYRGHDGCAGEIGHTFSDLQSHTEIEELFAGPGLHKRFAEENLTDMLEKYVREWQKKKGRAFEIFENYLDELSTWLTNLILTFNPGIIVFGGGIGTDILPPLLPTLEQKVRKTLKTKGFSVSVHFKSSRLENAGALGAALFARERFEGETIR